MISNVEWIPVWCPRCEKFSMYHGSAIEVNYYSIDYGWTNIKCLHCFEYNIVENNPHEIYHVFGWNVPMRYVEPLKVEVRQGLPIDDNYLTDWLIDAEETVTSVNQQEYCYNLMSILEQEMAE